MRYVIFLILAVCMGHVAADGTEDAASNLLSSQNPDGSFGSSDRGLESQIYTTAKVLEGLIYYEENSGAIDRGISWILLKKPEDTGALSEVARLLYLTGEEEASFLSALKKYQNSDGGWGKTGGFKSTNWHTCTAVVAFNPFEEYRETVIMGGEYLLRKQGGNGDFSDSTVITSDCVYALVLLYNSTKRDDFAWGAIRGYEWLNKTATDDWDDVDSASRGAIALDALYGLSLDDDIKALSDNAKEWISGSGRINGGLLSTAHALIALTKDTAIYPAKPSATIRAELSKTDVFPTETTDVRIKMENSGIVRLKNVSLYLYAPKDLQAKIEITEWKVGGLNRNESQEFSESIYISAEVKEGEYPITIHAGPFNSTVVLKVLNFPILFELGPSNLKNDVLTDFELLVKNPGEGDIFIKNITFEMDEKLRELKLENAQFDLPSGTEKSVPLFSARAPVESGEYRGTLTIDFIHPTFGEREIALGQKLTVGGTIPLGILKFVLYATIILSVMLILNLVTGYDLLG